MFRVRCGFAAGVEGEVFENVKAVVYIFDVEGELFVGSPGRE